MEYKYVVVEITNHIRAIFYQEKVQHSASPASWSSNSYLVRKTVLSRYTNYHSKQWLPRAPLLSLLKLIKWKEKKITSWTDTGYSSLQWNENLFKIMNPFIAIIIVIIPHTGHWDTMIYILDPIWLLSRTGFWVAVRKRINTRIRFDSPAVPWVNTVGLFPFRPAQLVHSSFLKSL